jgi:shell matrix protein
MSYDIYKKLMGCSNSSNRNLDNKNTIEKTDLQANKTRKEDQTALEGNLSNWERIDNTLEALSLNYPRWTISLEEDNPFDGIGTSSDDNDAGFDDNNDTSTDDNPFGEDDNTSDNDQSSGGDDNPFDFGGDNNNDNESDDDFFSGGDDDSNDFFGGGDDNDDNQNKKPKKEVKLNRKDVLKQEFDINKQVRSVFPKRFLELQDVIKANISMCERVVIQDASHIDVFDQLIEEYNRLAKIVDDYLSIIIEKPHDDIFATYFTIFTNLSKLKDIYNELVNNDEKK